jgi:uncharacterized protein YehS (DUF1456 family)
MSWIDMSLLIDIEISYDDCWNILRHLFNDGFFVCNRNNLLAFLSGLQIVIKYNASKYVS